MRFEKYARTIIFILVGLFITVDSFAIELNLQQAISLALRESEDFQVAQIDEEQATSEYEMARSSMLPNISAAGTYSRNFDRSLVPTSVPTTTGAAAYVNKPLVKRYGLDTSVTLGQLLFSFGQVYHAVQATAVAKDISTLKKESSRQDIIMNTTNAYYGVVLAQKALDISEESYQNAKINKSILTKKYSSGRSTQSDLVRMNRDIAVRKPQVSNAKAEYKTALATLKYLLNFRQETDLVLEDSFPVDPMKADLTEIEGQADFNSDVKILKKKLKVDEHVIKSKRASFLPTISAFMNYSYQGSSDQYDFPGDYQLNHVGTIGIQVSIPIYEGGKTASSYQQAVLERAKTSTNLRKAKRAVTLELRNSYNDYQAQKEIYKENLKSITLAKKTFQISRKRFKTGQTTVTELNDAELLLTQSKLNKELTLFKINQLKAKIDRLTK